MIRFPYKFVMLKNDVEFKDYNSCYVTNGGDQPVPLDWMQRSKVFGVYKNNQLVAGYVECCPPVRSTADIPAEIRAALLEKHCGDLQNVQENAAFWIQRKTPDKVALQAFVWATIVWRSVFCTTCGYTLGVANRKSISDLYKFFCGRVIYKAPSKLIPGDTYHVFLWSKTQLLTVGGRILVRMAKSAFRRKLRPQGIVQPLAHESADTLAPSSRKAA
jgi:hypothetical protein